MIGAPNTRSQKCWGGIDQWEARNLGFRGDSGYFSQFQYDVHVHLTIEKQSDIFIFHTIRHPKETSYWNFWLKKYHARFSIHNQHHSHWYFDSICHKIPKDAVYPIRYALSIVVLCFGDLIVLGAWWRHQMKKNHRCWSSARGIQWWPLDNPHKGQQRGALIFSLICTWTNVWANSGGDTGELSRHRTHYDDVTVMGCDHFHIHLGCLLWLWVARLFRYQ